MEPDLKNQLEDARQKFHELSVQMGAKRQEFLHLCHTRLKTWYLETTAQAIEDQFILSRQLGRARLGEMKAEIESLVDRLAAGIDSELGAAALWWHVQPAAQSYATYDYRDERRKTAPLYQAVDRLAGRLLKVLQKYGYAKETASLPAVRWTDEMEKALRAYATLQDQAANLARQLARLEKEAGEKERRQEARQLWESAQPRPSRRKKPTPPAGDQQDDG